MTPGWILGVFAVIMLVVAAVSAARLVAARGRGGIGRGRRGRWFAGCAGRGRA
jgi:hypothetical protein